MATTEQPEAPHVSAHPLTEGELAAVRRVLNWLDDDAIDVEAFPPDFMEPGFMLAVGKLCRREVMRADGLKPPGSWPLQHDERPDEPNWTRAAQSSYQEPPRPQLVAKLSDVAFDAAAGATGSPASALGLLFRTVGAFAAVMGADPTRAALQLAVDCGELWHLYDAEPVAPEGSI